MKFDINKFWSLPTCTHALSDGQGRYCAMGAFFASATDRYEAILSNDEHSRVVNINNYGIDTAECAAVVRQRFLQYSYFNPHPNANPERAKRLVVELLLAKGVEIEGLATMPAMAEPAMAEPAMAEPEPIAV